MMQKEPSIVIFSQTSLRIEDNPALNAACIYGPVLPVFIFSPNIQNNRTIGSASKWWLHYSLNALKNDLMKIGLPLIVRKGNPLRILPELIKQTKADSIFWNIQFEPELIEQDALLKKDLLNLGVKVQTFNGSLLFEPWAIANKQGKPFQVFTPFWKTCLSQLNLEKTLPIIKNCKSIPNIQTETIDSLELLPKTHWDQGLENNWAPGTQSAKKLLTIFINEKIEDYIVARDIPSVEGISKLSPHLHFGEISPGMILQAIRRKYPKDANLSVECFIKQLGWREFAHHLLFHFPLTPKQPLRKDFLSFPWKKNESKLNAWKKGLTGYPIVDAGMRQLWSTGWMHNRVRMIVGSFLVKDLLISWTEGADWFWDTLVDADLANNTMGWQWIGGCGADAAPYFRVFNPTTQGNNFDPEGHYVKKWVPELVNLPNKWIHQPWNAPEIILKEAGIIIGKTYPKPIVDHAKAKLLALNAFASLKN